MIMLIGLVLIITFISIKFKSVYVVEIDNDKVGYVENKEAFEESIKNGVLTTNERNVDSIVIENNPEYELALINKNETTNEDEILNKIEKEAQVTYKYYEIALNNEAVNSVDTIEEAKQVINDVKQENENADLSIVEKYTENKNEVATKEETVAKEEIQTKIEEQKNNEKAENNDSNLTNINGIQVATLPVTGTITSRYGESSRLRKSTHTGLDIACITGTSIKAVADGVVKSAEYTGSYGNLVKIDHGNGIETWYGHTSKMFVTKGQEVKAGDIIAAVGSTGNSTGPHLHFEIRINGNTVNPQNYLYN